MNLRQKAKKYKQRITELENMVLPTRTIFRDRTNLKHYRTCCTVTDLYLREETKETIAKDKIWGDLKELVNDSVEFDGTVYSLDVWVK